MEDVLDTLDSGQRRAVETTEGYIRVIAGAGSGKTRTLVHRFAYLVNDIGIRPGNILCATFTNKAAGEMRQRIHALTGDNDTGYVNTFHGFCVSVLQEDSHAIQYPRSFLVLDNSDIDAMLRVIYEERGLTLRDMTFAKARDYFEMRKGVYEPMYHDYLVDMSLEKLHRKYLDATELNDILFYGYLYQQKKCFGVDYNDLIFLTLRIFRQEKKILLKWQKRLEYIMVDEFQDIDAPQYELMSLLCAYHNNLFVVGDPDQTIYSWRGADVELLLKMDERFPGVETIILDNNYRSTPQIVAVANSLIAKNHERIEKSLVSMCPAGSAVRFHHAKTAQQEAMWMAQEIARLHEAGMAYSDMAILYRAHYVTREIEEEFIKKGLPYKIYSGTQFYDRVEIKDALSYLRMIAFQDDLSFMRICNVPKRNIGQRRMGFLKVYAEEHGCSLYRALQENIDHEIFSNTQARGFVDLIERFRRKTGSEPVSVVLGEILDASGYEEMLRTEGAQNRLDDLAELKQAVQAFEMLAGEEVDLASYLGHVALLTNQDRLEQRDEVKMMTIHAAKGLEFPAVFLCAMNEGIIPSRKTRSEPQMEEERRLAFVALTRAKRNLCLSDAEGKNLDNTTRYVSRFVFDIDKGLMDFDEPLADSLQAGTVGFVKKHNLLPDKAKIPFAIGDRVWHPVFHEGTITDISYEEEAVFIQFDNKPTVRALALRAVGKLKPLAVVKNMC